jgi:general secretion pathway protein I
MVRQAHRERSECEHGVHSRAQTRDHHERRIQRAFSLIEVLVALTILAVGLIAASRAAGVATFEQSALRDRTLARWVAHNALAEVRLVPMMASPGSSAKEHIQADTRFIATTVVTTTPSPLFSRVEVRVTRADRPDYELARAVGFSSRS